ncbi:MAG: tetratricopeptide repeat protein [Thermodesulfobacteriota bacterium]
MLKKVVLFLFLVSLVVTSGCSRDKTSEKAGKEAGEKVWIERWAEQRAMNMKRAGVAAVSVGNRIYAIGGANFNRNRLTPYDSVEYTEVLDDGTLSEWRFTSTMTTTRIYPAAVVYGDYIYVLGGESEDSLAALLDTVERAKINPDGTLGKWILEKERMHSTRRGGGIVVYKDWIYAIGGFNGMFLDDIERAKINPDGSVGKWIREKNKADEVRYISGYVGNGDRIYLIGGHLNAAIRATDSIEVAKINPDSSVGKWKQTTPMYTKKFLHSSLVVDNTIYSIAGQNTVTLTGTERAEILEDGTLSQSVPDTPLNTPRRAAASVRVGDTVYMLGGMLGAMGEAVSVESVESATIVPGKKLGHWVASDSKEMELYKDWKESTPLDAENHLKHAVKYLARKDYSAVIFDTSEILKIDPQNIKAHNLKGYAYYSMGEFDSAVDTLKKTLTIEDTNIDALSGLANISFEKGDFAEAIDYYKMALQTSPDSTIIHENLGQSYLNIEDYASAAEEFRLVLKQKPDLEHAKTLLDIAEGKMNKP